MYLKTKKRKINVKERGQKCGFLTKYDLTYAGWNSAKETKTNIRKKDKKVALSRYDLTYTGLNKFKRMDPERQLMILIVFLNVVLIK